MKTRIDGTRAVLEGIGAALGLVGSFSHHDVERAFRDFLKSKGDEVPHIQAQQRRVLFHVGAAMRHLEHAHAELGGVSPEEPAPPEPTLEHNIQRILASLTSAEELTLAQSADGRQVDAYVTDSADFGAGPMQGGHTPEDAVAALAIEMEQLGKIAPHPGCP